MNRLAYALLLMLCLPFAAEAQEGASEGTGSPSGSERTAEVNTYNFNINIINDNKTSPKEDQEVETDNPTKQNESGSTCRPCTGHPIPFDTYRLNWGSSACGLSVCMPKDSGEKGNEGSCSSRFPKIPYGRLVRLEVCGVNPFVYALESNVSVYVRPIDPPELFEKSLMTVDTESISEGKIAVDRAFEDYKIDARADTGVKVQRLQDAESEAMKAVERFTEEIKTANRHIRLLQALLAIYRNPSSPADKVSKEAAVLLAGFFEITDTTKGPPYTTHLIENALMRKENVENAFRQSEKALADAIRVIQDESVVSRLQDTEKAIEAAFAQFNSLEIKASTETVMYMHSRLENNGFCREVAFVQAKGDHVDVQLTKKPLEGMLVADQPLTTEFTIPIKRGAQFTFTAMPFMAFIREADYFVTNPGGGSQYSIQERDIEHRRFGVANMLNVTWRSGGWTTLGGSLGVGLDSRGGVNFFLGGTGVLGKEQRFSVHAGLALREINTLPFSNQVGQVVSGPTFQIPDATEIGFGFFTGIGIALGGDKED